MISLFLLPFINGCSGGAFWTAFRRFWPTWIHSPWRTDGGHYPYSTSCFPKVFVFRTFLVNPSSAEAVEQQSCTKPPTVCEISLFLWAALIAYHLLRVKSRQRGGGLGSPSGWAVSASLSGLAELAINYFHLHPSMKWLFGIFFCVFVYPHDWVCIHLLHSQLNKEFARLSTHPSGFKRSFCNLSIRFKGFSCLKALLVSDIFWNAAENLKFFRKKKLLQGLEEETKALENQKRGKRCPWQCSAAVERRGQKQKRPWHVRRTVYLHLVFDIHLARLSKNGRCGRKRSRGALTETQLPVCPPVPSVGVCLHIVKAPNGPRRGLSLHFWPPGSAFTPPLLHLIRAVWPS